MSLYRIDELVHDRYKKGMYLDCQLQTSQAVLHMIIAAYKPVAERIARYDGYKASLTATLNSIIGITIVVNETLATPLSWQLVETATGNVIESGELPWPLSNEGALLIEGREIASG
jgi:hypothetical protein